MAFSVRDHILERLRKRKTKIEAELKKLEEDAIQLNVGRTILFYAKTKERILVSNKDGTEMQFLESKKQSEVGPAIDELCDLYRKDSNSSKEIVLSIYVFAVLPSGKEIRLSRKFWVDYFDRQGGKLPKKTNWSISGDGTYVSNSLYSATSTASITPFYSPSVLTIGAQNNCQVKYKAKKKNP